MQTTKKIHLSPNGNIIKINGNIYRHYTRNLNVSLPSIFYAISHGATVYEVLDNGDTIQLTTQNYALDNNKNHKDENLEKQLKLEEMSKIQESMDKDTEKVENDISEQYEAPEIIESNDLTDEYDDYPDDEDKSYQKKSSKRNNTKKNITE